MKRWLLLATVPLVALSVVIPVSGNSLPLHPSAVAGAPAISASPTAAKPQQLVTVSGSGFQPHSGAAVARVSINGAVLNGTGSPVSATGTFSAGIRVPELPSGVYSIVAEGFAPQTAGQAATPTSTEIPPPTGTSTSVPTPTSTATTVSTPTNTVAPTPTNTLAPAPTSTATATVTGTATPTPTPPPTQTAVVIVRPPTPTFTTVPRPTATFTSIPVRPTATGTPAFPSPTPTNTPCPPTVCGGAALGQGFQMNRSLSPVQPAGPLVFDGDRATVSFTVTAPKAPFGVSQSATCNAVPTVGVTTTCTITEVITNNGLHTLDFSHTVVNHLSSNVHAVSASTTTGAIAISGSAVTWNNFQVTPGKTVSASIQVSFTPTAAQVGSQVVLSDGITATAVDVVTGQRFTVQASSLSTPTRVVTAGGTAAAAAATAGHGGAVSGLPTTGGAVELNASLPRREGHLGKQQFDRRE